MIGNNELFHDVINLLIIIFSISYYTIFFFNLLDAMQYFSFVRVYC